MAHTTSRYVASLMGGLVLMTSQAFADESSKPANAVQSAPPMGYVLATETVLKEQTIVNGRIEAINQVTLTARLNAVLEDQHFTDGADVKEGDLLFTLEKGPFRAEVDARKAAVAQAEAQLENAKLSFTRAQELLARAAGSQSTADSALAAKLSAEAQVDAAKAQLQAAEINYNYTEIRTPIAGRISRSLVKPGNILSPGTALTSVVSQEPMNVTFPISVRIYQEIGSKASAKGKAFPSTVRLRLANGEIYDHQGKLDFIDNNISLTTDTIMLRAEIPNPVIPKDKGGNGQLRQLVHNEYVSVILEEDEGQTAIHVPSSAVMTSKQGNSVIVIADDNIARPRPVKVARLAGFDAIITSGLKAGERVAIDGFHFMRGPEVPVLPVDKSAQFSVQNK